MKHRADQQHLAIAESVRKSIAQMQKVARLEGRRDALQEAALELASRSSELTGTGAANVLRDLAWDAEQRLQEATR